MAAKSEDVKDMVSRYKISIASLVVILPSLIGCLTFVDSRYAHAEDERAKHSEQARQLNEFRKDDLEDKIFMLQLKRAQAQEQRKKVDPLDAAMLERYQKKLDQVNKQQPD